MAQLARQGQFDHKACPILCCKQSPHENMTSLPPPAFLPPRYSILTSPLTVIYLSCYASSVGPGHTHEETILESQPYGESDSISCQSWAPIERLWCSAEKTHQIAGGNPVVRVQFGTVFTLRVWPLPLYSAHLGPRASRRSPSLPPQSVSSSHRTSLAHRIAGRHSRRPLMYTWDLLAAEDDIVRILRQ